MRYTLLLLFACAFIFQSCSTSNDVAHDGLFQKRKYRKGLHADLAWKRSADTKPVQEFGEVENERWIGPKKLEKAEQISNKDNKWWYKSVEVQSDEVKLYTTNDERMQIQDRETSRVEKMIAPSVFTRHHQSEVASQIRQKTLTKSAGLDDPKTAGIVSIVIGGLVLMILLGLPIINIAASIAGLVFGKRARDGGEETLGIIGLVLNGIGLGLSVLMSIIVVLYLIFVLAFFI